MHGLCCDLHLSVVDEVSEVIHAPLSLSLSLSLQDLPHEERERAGVSSYHGRGKPLPNPAATVFIGNVSHKVSSISMYSWIFVLFFLFFFPCSLTMGSLGRS